jgi:hypothetical protein
MLLFIPVISKQAERVGGTRMKQRQHRNVITLLFILAAISLLELGTARGQVVSLPEKDAVNQAGTSAASTREETAVPSPLKETLRQQQNANKRDDGTQQAIVIGFVGGFVKHDDPKHPEVQFAAYLRDRYPSAVHAEVFSNHSGQEAFLQVLRLLDTDHDGTLTTAEKEHARIIIYGHSWGASETVSLARKLEEQGIPVLLTIQVDIIAKPGQKGSTIPPNVAKAVNFYQSRGPFHGRSEIFAADPARTKIIGSFQLSYENHPINCDNYRWYARVFNKPHNEIENDPRVWDQAASLIDSELSDRESTPLASFPSKSPFFSLVYGHP